MQTCVGQVMLNLIDRCNETSNICDKLRIDTHDVKFEDSGGITVTFRGHRLGEDTVTLGLSMYIQIPSSGYVPEDLLYENMIHELQNLLEGYI